MRYISPGFLVGFVVGVVASFAFAVFALGGDVEAAIIDREQFSIDDRPHLYYFGFEAIPEDRREQTLQVLKFVLASLSRQQIIEYCQPIPVTETLYRIDLRSLQWDSTQAATVFNRTPYKTGHLDAPALVNRPDWFIVEVTDTADSDAYYRLLYGKTELTRDQFLDVWGVGQKAVDPIGFIEGNSGVSVQKVRWLTQFDTDRRTDIWGTLDFLKITNDTDPLNNLDYAIDKWRQSATANHDGEEWIAGMPKVSIATKQRGRLQAYLLSDGNGQRVEEAPGRLVRDSSLFRGHGAITNFGACVSCHKTGLNPITQDEARRYLEATTKPQILIKDKAQGEQLELFVLSPINQLISRANEDYATAVELVCGVKPEEISASLVEVVHRYDQPVTAELAALEQYVKPLELQLALGHRDNAYADLTARQAMLSAGESIPRKTWEDNWRRTYEAVLEWKESQGD